MSNTYKEPEIDDATLTAICDAYEAGMGKGLCTGFIEVKNPYTPGIYAKAWDIGYKEGKKRA